jgi:ATP-dependent Lhr-like helicase
MAATARASALDRFSAAARAWFGDTFEAPTQAQELGWNAIAAGEHTLLLAPTGSGKTLAAFLWCVDKLANRPPLPVGKNGKPVRVGVSVLYISPLKALSYDVERNLRAPLAGLRIAAAREGLPPPDIAVATRTGDTPARERADLRKDPPDILITTPESLYLMLTSQAKSVLETVGTVIIDEIHTMAGTKRGAHLSLSLERLERLTGRPFQRIGLSATQRPLEEVAKYLGGDRAVRIADAGARRDLDLKVVVPVEDMTRLGDLAGPVPESEVSPEARTSIWPAIYPRMLELVRQHRSTLLFVNNRRLAERLAARINELAGEELLRAHHGSVSREQRLEAEEMLKSGQLPGLVCTSSMELGVDMGAVDLVIQVESPKSVARGLQRVGRAGHQVGATSIGRIFPKFRGDLLECAVVTKRMREGLIEKTEVPRNPLDVLAQQIVAMCAADDLTVDEVFDLVRRSYNFSSLSREQLEGVLGMLSGQYPSDEFADLKPRILWDRDRDVLSSRRDARTVALVNAGTIPDRGLYGVFLGVGGPRVGELDEEMVYESRPGETFLLGATTWRIEQITRDQVIVAPAPGEPGKMPFWKGDGVGRPLEFGRAIGQFTRELDAIKDPAVALERLTVDHDLDANAAQNLLAYLHDEKEETGQLPTDKILVVQRFRDELGDWRMVLLSPFGGQVHAPWAQAIEATLAEQSGFDVQTIWSDDGIAIRFAGGEEPPPAEMLFPSPEAVEEMVVSRLANTAMFASHFRENAGRALLLPRKRPGARSPLWLQRQRSANLLAVASRYGSFPIVLETYRECLRDVFDLPGLIEVLRQVQSREIRIASVETREASPFARSLLFDYVAAYMYEGDAPLAERRAQALTLDRNLLRDLLGEAELRELLDPAALDEVELELQCLVDVRKARTLDQVHDLLRRLGDLDAAEVADRLVSPAMAEPWLAELEGQRRACRVRIGGATRWIPIEDAGRFRDALGVSVPLGVPEAFLKRTEGALEGLLRRYARTHGPFVTAGPARRWTLPESLVRETLEEMDADGVVVHGDFRPGGTEREWCDPEVLRQIKRRSLARLRKEVEPVDGAAYARFLLRWHGIGSTQRGPDRLRDVLMQIEGAPIAAAVLEREVLAARVSGFQPAMLDALVASGEVAWFGSGKTGKDDGRVTLVRREMLDLFAPVLPEALPPLQQAIVEALRAGGALFFSDLVGATNAPYQEVLDAIWELVWAGAVTNDTLAPVRALAWPKRAGGPGPRGRMNKLPAESAGRWSLVRRLPFDESRARVTARAHARAEVLLERLGIVTREGVAADDLPGGFSAVYPVLKGMEDAGRVRRGYFVEGHGAAQFCLPGAAERVRGERELPDEPVTVVLAATDPSQPYGATLAWPRDEAEARKPYQRVPGARVVLVDGTPLLYLDRSHRGLMTFPAAADERLALLALLGLARDGVALGNKGLSIERVDGIPATESGLAPLLREAGFAQGFRGFTRRPERAEAMAHA